jgi:hypothetical protein
LRNIIETAGSTTIDNNPWILNYLGRYIGPVTMHFSAGGSTTPKLAGFFNKKIVSFLDRIQTKSGRWRKKWS